jgi:hypothetical protein
VINIKKLAFNNTISIEDESRKRSIRQLKVKRNLRFKSVWKNRSKFVKNMKIVKVNRDNGNDG